MSQPLTSTPDHLQQLRDEGERLAAMPPDHLDAPVPALTDWTLERVVRHVGKVHQWVRSIVAAPADVDPASLAADLPGMPRGAACLPAYHQALNEVIAALSESDPNQRVATFLGVDDVAFWCRRQAHEVTVHRMDAADAWHHAGGPPPDAINPAGASDGIDEWLSVFVATHQDAHDGEALAVLAGRKMSLATTTGDTWLVELDDVGHATATYRAPNAPTPTTPTVDVNVHGDPQSLLLACWRRRPLDTLTIEGDRRVISTFIDVMRF